MSKGVESGIRFIVICPQFFFKTLRAGPAGVELTTSRTHAIV